MSGRRIIATAFAAAAATMPAACTEQTPAPTFTFGIECAAAPDGKSASLEIVHALGRDVVVMCLDSDGSPLDVRGIGRGAARAGSLPGYTALVTITGPEGSDPDPSASFGFKWGKTITEEIAADGGDPPPLDPELIYGHVRFSDPNFEMSGATVQPAP